MSNQQNKPVFQFDDFPISVAIWRYFYNESIYHNITIQKAYKTDGQWKHTQQMNGEDLLNTAHLLQQAHEWCRQDSNAFYERQKM